jgi:hypothetical protein
MIRVEIQMTLIIIIMNDIEVEKFMILKKKKKEVILVNLMKKVN